MSGQVDPISFPQAWDYCVIGGIVSPLCEIKEWKRAHEFDVKKGKGTLGATVTFVGRPPAKGSIRFLLYQPSDFVLWDQLRPNLKYDPTKKAVQAADIYHPSLADIDITSVVTESIGNIVHEGLQLYSVTVDFIEYFPPPNAPAISTPTSALQGFPHPQPGGPPPTEQDALQQQIQGLLGQAGAP